MQADLVAIRKRFVQAEDDELLRVAHADAQEYIAEVIALAREELGRRGVDYARSEIEAAVAQRREQEREDQRAYDGKPLHPFGGIACALVGVIVSLIVAIVLHGNGRRRAAQQAILWAMAGIAAKLFVLAAASAIVGA